MSIELKPCQFCGKLATFTKMPHRPEFNDYCDVCTAEMARIDYESAKASEQPVELCVYNGRCGNHPKTCAIDDCKPKVAHIELEGGEESTKLFNKWAKDNYGYSIAGTAWRAWQECWRHWSKSFDGHVYITDEEYQRLIKRESGYRDELRQTAVMLEKHVDELFPAENGKRHFAGAMMLSAAESIFEFLGELADCPDCNGIGWDIAPGKTENHEPVQVPCPRCSMTGKINPIEEKQNEAGR